MKAFALLLCAFLVLACSAHSPGKRNNGGMNGNGNTGNCSGGGGCATCFDCTAMEIANIYNFPNVVTEVDSFDPLENVGPNPNNAAGLNSWLNFNGLTLIDVDGHTFVLYMNPGTLNPAEQERAVTPILSRDTVGARRQSRIGTGDC